MAWTPPRTWVPGEFVTALMMNTHVRDNMLDLNARILAGGGASWSSTWTGKIEAVNGTVAAPSHSFSTSPTTGRYLAAANDMRDGVSGVDLVKYTAGAVVISGTLAASGNFAINTDKFTVTAASGNTVVAGTLGVTGAATFTGTVTATTFSGSGASLTALPAGNLTGTVATGRIAGSYTGITAVGTLTGLTVTGPATIQTLTVGLGAGAITSNTVLGYRPLFSNTTGSYNTASGSQALYLNTTGSYSTASGTYALYSNTTGNNNTGSGFQALYGNTTGNHNTASGFQALYLNTTASNNTAIGSMAGRYSASGTALITPANSTFIGYDTRASVDAGTNETVIGYAAVGNGSNTVTIGNASVTATYLQGNLVWASRSRIFSSADGTITLFNNASNNFDRLQFGGTTSAFPAWKRSGTTLVARLADNSADAPITASVGTFSGAVVSNSATGGIGYTTGAGGTVTQLTSKATGVTLSTVTGNITLNAAALAANTSVSFTLTNTAIAATDLVVVTHHSAGTAGAYTTTGQAAAGSAVITVRNVTAGSLGEAIVLKFAIIKGATS